MVANMRNSRDIYEETCDFVGDLRPSTSNKWRFDWPSVGCLSMFIPVGFVRKWKITTPFFCHVDGINHDQPSAFGGPKKGPIFSEKLVKPWMPGWMVDIFLL
jgi:hypothetical protein